MSRIQNFIKTNNIETLEQLKERLPRSVYFKESKDFDHAILCYQKMDLTDPNIDFLMECNGTILDDKLNIVSMGLSRTIDSKNLAGEGDDELSNNNLENFNVSYALSGSLIRLWWNEKSNEWTLNTSKTIDARDTNWGSSVSFHDIFWEICDGLDVSKLNKNFTYSFIMRHPKISNVIAPCPCASIYHVSTRNLETFKELDLSLDESRVFINPETRKINHHINTEFFTDNKVPLSIIPEEFKGTFYNGTLEEFIQKYSKEELPFNEPYCGFILESQDRKKRYSVYTEKYLDMVFVRGNTQTIEARYVQLMNDPMTMMKLRNYYCPFKTKSFELIDSTFKKTCYDIWQTYHTLYIKKDKSIRYNPKFRPILYGLHGDFIDFKKRGITRPTSLYVVTQKVIGLDYKQRCSLLGVRY